MNENGQGVNWLSLRNFGLGAVILLVLVGIMIAWLFLRRDSQQALMPDLPTPTPYVQATPKEPDTVTFTELNENPLLYLNQPLVVSGDYLPVENSGCVRVTGPDIKWALTADNLQLDVVGFEHIVDLVPAGTNMTVQGIWRFYQGHHGCGKAPPIGSVWYLEAKKIIQPNPLVSANGRRTGVEIINSEQGLPAFLPTELPPSSDLVPTQTPMPTLPAGVLPTPTISDQIIPTPTEESPLVLTPSPTVLISTPTISPANTPDPNATATATPDATNTTATSSPDSGAPTLTSEPPPSLATSPPSDYPGPPTPTWTPPPTNTPYP